jgi:hypothetical protein
MVAVFSKVLFDEAMRSARLGMPSADEGERLRRLNLMSNSTGGRGFRVPPAEPRVHATFGTTRGQRKRATYARLFLNREEASQ